MNPGVVPRLKSSLLMADAAFGGLMTPDLSTGATLLGCATGGFVTIHNPFHHPDSKRWGAVVSISPWSRVGQAARVQACPWGAATRRLATCERNGGEDD